MHVFYDDFYVIIAGIDNETATCWFKSGSDLDCGACSL